MTNTILQDTGKINRALFQQLLPSGGGKTKKSVVQGPSWGVDTAVIDLGAGLGLAVTSDPLSLVPSLGLRESAWLSVHLMANDMAATGFAPEYVQLVTSCSINCTAWKSQRQR